MVAIARVSVDLQPSGDLSGEDRWMPAAGLAAAYILIWTVFRIIGNGTAGIEWSPAPDEIRLKRLFVTFITWITRCLVHADV